MNATMNERLDIKDFLLIKKARFDVGRINVIVGKQASGKSVISKLLYFGREFMSRTFITSIEENQSRQDLRDSAVEKFIEYFPKYTWEKKAFSIKYGHGDAWFKIENKEIGKNRFKLCFELSEALRSFHLSKKSQFKSFRKNKVENTSQADSSFFIDNQFYEFRAKSIITDKLYKNKFGIPFFIPASRSFFANVQKSIFSFMSSNSGVDPFFKIFGRLYENAKSMYKEDYFLNPEKKELLRVKKMSSELVQSILLGDYQKVGEKDWIINKGQRINIADASSGQQEALPMFILLSVYPFFESHGGSKLFFIEEPEAHLFPSAQKSVAKLIVLLHSIHSNSFVLTTHSPYIITALNNILLASDIRRTDKAELLPKSFNKRFDLKYEDVKAYTLKNGVLKSVLDKPNRLIGSDIIDEVSTEFENEFDELLNIMYEK